jgi:2-dehydro-3-deoxyphosphogluconate aldolase/(4S)-4-hydroxy-2-oxoglutarate aldolase
MNVLELMHIGPVIPVIVVDNAERAVLLARALVAGGVRVLEITLRTTAAFDATRAIAREVEHAIVGVGTITRAEHVEQAVAAGAQFGVSPGLTPALIAAAKASNLALLPGVMTPSDIIAARSAGLTELKLFPAQQAGGIGMLNALYGPFPDVMFCPTGGVTAASAPDYLARPNVACVGGSWLTPQDAVARGDWPRITALARAAACLRATASDAGATPSGVPQ